MDSDLLVVLSLWELIVSIVLGVATALIRLVQVLATAETELLLEPLDLFLAEFFRLA